MRSMFVEYLRVDILTRFDRREKKKMGVMTNNGVEFDKKKMGLRETMY